VGRKKGRRGKRPEKGNILKTNSAKIKIQKKEGEDKDIYYKMEGGYLIFSPKKILVKRLKVSKRGRGRERNIAFLSQLSTNPTYGDQKKDFQISGIMHGG